MKLSLYKQLQDDDDVCDNHIWGNEQVNNYFTRWTQYGITRDEEAYRDGFR